MYVFASSNSESFRETDENIYIIRMTYIALINFCQQWYSLWIWFNTQTTEFEK